MLVLYTKCRLPYKNLKPNPSSLLQVNTDGYTPVSESSDSCKLGPCFQYFVYLNWSLYTSNFDKPNHISTRQQPLRTSKLLEFSPCSQCALVSAATCRTAQMNRRWELHLTANRTSDNTSDLAYTYLEEG